MSKVRILGIDPGSRITGFGLIECDTQSSSIRILQAGTLVMEDGERQSLVQRLGGLFESTCELLDRYQPDWVVVEKIFLSKNPHAAFVLGHARGVILGVVGVRQLCLAEYTPREVKRSLTGHGGATKAQVADLLRQRFGVSGHTSWDSSDALALACHHAMVLLEQEKLKQATY